MPTIIEYFGIIIKFFSNEHLPVHVHAFYGSNMAMKVEFFLQDDKIVKKNFKGGSGL